MAINKKGKRKITVNSKKYLWWVFDEYDQTTFDGIQIKIVAENQVGYIQYGLQQSDKERTVVISLRNEKHRIHLLCPKFEDKNGIITPSGIAQLIKWSVESPTPENRILVHGYNSGIGVIPQNNRLNTLGIIVKEFLK